MGVGSIRSSKAISHSSEEEADEEDEEEDLEAEAMGVVRGAVLLAGVMLVVMFGSGRRRGPLQFHFSPSLPSPSFE